MMRCINFQCSILRHFHCTQENERKISVHVLDKGAVRSFSFKLGNNIEVNTGIVLGYKLGLRVRRLDKVVERGA